MKKLFFGLIAATVLTAGVFIINSNIVNAEPGSEYKKTPINLEDPCYSTGGNCLSETEIVADSIPQSGY